MHGVRPPSQPAQASSSRAWGIVLLLCVAYTLSFVDRQILTLMVDPISRDLGLSDTQFSLLHGAAFALFYTLMGLPLGYLVDRLDRMRIVAAGVAFWSLMTAACGLSRNYVHLFLARMGVGVGEAALSPAAYSMLSDLFPPNKLGRAISVYSLGIAAGLGLAFIAGGYVVKLVTALGPTALPGVGVLRPWQLVLAGVGAPGLLLALAFLMLRDPDRRGGSPEAGNVRDAVRFVFGQRAFFWRFLIGLALMTGFGHATLGWTPSYFIRVHGWTPEQVGLRYGFGVLFGAATGMCLGGWLSDRLQARGIVDAPVRVAAAGILACLPLGVAAMLTPNAGLAVLLCALVMLAYNMPFGVAGAALQLATPNHLRGQISALYLFTINIIGLGAGPTLTALLTDRLFGRDGVGLALAVTAALLLPVAAWLTWTARTPYANARANPIGA